MSKHSDWGRAFWRSHHGMRHAIGREIQRIVAERAAARQVVEVEPIVLDSIEPLVGPPRVPKRRRTKEQIDAAKRAATDAGADTPRSADEPDEAGG